MASRSQRASRPGMLFALLIVVGSLSAGCATLEGERPAGYIAADNPKYLARYGTKQFYATGPDAFTAARQALTSQGFVVAIANAERGLIRTAPKTVALTTTSSRWSGEVALQQKALQLSARLAPEADRVKVAFHVRLYINGVDVTREEQIFSEELYRLWQQLFDAMYDALPSRDQRPAGDSTVL